MIGNDHDLNTGVVKPIEFDTSHTNGIRGLTGLIGTKMPTPVISS